MRGHFILCSTAVLCLFAGFVWGICVIKYHWPPYAALVEASDYKSPRIDARRDYLAGKTTHANIVFVGDSIFQSIEWAEEFPGAVNRGIQSDTTLDVIDRLPSLAAIDAETYVIMLGTNDMAQGRDNKDIAASMEYIASSLPGHKILMSVTPCAQIHADCDQNRIDHLNDTISHIPDVEFVEASLDTNSDLADWIHPNASGKAKLIAAIGPYLTR